MIKLRNMIVMLAALAGCAATDVLQGQSVSERFRSKLNEYERLCGSGHYNDASTGCRLLKLSPRTFDGPGMVRVEGQPLLIPREWVQTEEGRFAHSIRLPQPLSADSGYRQEMTPQQYFEHLCAKEAGEFIYRTVEKVEGLYQMRPRIAERTEMLGHLYAMEDPYGYTTIVGAEAYAYTRPFRYAFFETAARVWDSKVPAERRARVHPSLYSIPSPGQNVERWSGYDGRNDSSARKEYDTKPLARYGYTWRGVRRPMDRDMGIAGAELLVLDLHTDEVLGVRRGFVLAATDREPSMFGFGWFAGICPRYSFPGQPGSNKGHDFEYWFIRKVLKPINLTKPEPYLDVKGN